MSPQKLKDETLEIAGILDRNTSVTHCNATNVTATRQRVNRNRLGRFAGALGGA
jgi:hypothetical protein